MRRKDQTERRWTSNILQVSDIHVKHVKKTFSQKKKKKKENIQPNRHDRYEGKLLQPKQNMGKASVVS